MLYFDTKSYQAIKSLKERMHRRKPDNIFHVSTGIQIQERTKHAFLGTMTMRRYEKKKAAFSSCFTAVRHLHTHHKPISQDIRELSDNIINFKLTKSACLI